MEAISRRQSFSEKGINVMSEKEKIIVFSSREICYQSSSFFANQMADAFENLGFDVQVCEFDEQDDLDAVFQPLYGKKYRLLLDFNSTITRMVEEDGTPVLDKLDGPFFDYILDHPLFHYNCLNADLKNLNGIFLDEAQEAYVKRYYPRVKKTLTMPLGATEAVTGGKKTETDTVLFMGTYDRPDKIYEMVELSPEPLRSYMKELLPTLDYWKKYDELSDNGQFEEFKKKLINEINELNVDGMPKVEKLNALVGKYVNLEYRLPNGQAAKFLNDAKTYLGNQLECEYGGDRCFGVVADMDFILICTYEEDGKNPELVLYKKR